MQTRTKESRKRLHSLILLTAFTCVLLIVSTYAWFTVQKDVNVSNIRGRVEVAEGLQISLDALNWTQSLDLGDGHDEDANASLTETTGFAYVPYTNHRNHVPDEMLPVSTDGVSATVPDADLEGKANVAVNELGMYVGKYEGDDSKKLTGVKRANEKSTAVSDTDYAGYYAFDIFLKNSSATGVTSDILQLNSDSSAWVLPTDTDITIDKDGTDVTYKGNKASGLQNTLRIAFARYGAGDSTGSGVINADATQAEALTGTVSQGIGAVSIWEPNHSSHTEAIQTNIGKLFAGGSLPTDPFFTRTLNKDITELADVFNWGEGTSLSMPKTVQTTPYDQEYGAINEGVKNLKTVDEEQQNFTLAANSITRLRVYIYLEGQDPDCDNSASRGGGVEVNIGLTKGETEGTFDRYNEVNGTNRTAAATPEAGE